MILNDEAQFVLDHCKEKMDLTISHLEKELLHIRAGKSNPAMVDAVTVDYYGSMVPLSQVANISTPDPRTIAIQPWEKKMIPVIEKAIMAANLGFNPDNNGEVIRINIPPLTEERRKNLVKQANKEGEIARVSIRTTRKESNEMLKKLQKNALPEDMEKDAKEKVQKLTDDFVKKIDTLVATKEKDIMTI